MACAPTITTASRCPFSASRASSKTRRATTYSSSTPHLLVVLHPFDERFAFGGAAPRAREQVRSDLAGRRIHQPVPFDGPFEYEGVPRCYEANVCARIGVSKTDY